MVKRSVDDLAVFGGPVAFAEPLHVGRPTIGDRNVLERRFRDILDRRWLTNDGVYVREFERRVADVAGVRHCVAFCNATLGLELLLGALDLRGEVIVPSFTFVATVHAVVRSGLTPVFCDIRPDSHTLDPDAVERAMSPRTAAILGVHLWGGACDVDALSSIAAKHALPLLFDAAHAVGSSYRGRPIGSFGTAEVFSFHATKFVNSFEGGAVTTDDAALAEKLRLRRNFGFADYDMVVDVGTNAKMPEPSAAMGLTSLEAMPSFLAANLGNHDAYERALAGIPTIRFVSRAEAGSNVQYVVVEIDPAGGITRDAVLRVLQAENVFARRYFYPGCHRMPPYRDVPLAQPLEITERVCGRVLSLPTGAAIPLSAVEEVARIIRFCAANAAEISDRLAMRDVQAMVAS
jgi:dTDP-4-amino-4,6-dideoxygalactose transaminase